MAISSFCKVREVEGEEEFVKEIEVE